MHGKSHMEHSTSFKKGLVTIKFIQKQLRLDLHGCQKCAGPQKNYQAEVWFSDVETAELQRFVLLMIRFLFEIDSIF